MYLLAIETTGAFASVALAKAETDNGKVTSFEVLGHVEGHDRFSHLQNLTPQIEQVIKDNGLPIGDIDVIAVSCGPGSFTGIRIGVSTARALSQVLGIPCVAVPSLEAMALRQSRYDAVACPIIDARRNQIYGGGFCINSETGSAIGSRPEETVKSGPYMVEEFMDAISDKGTVLFMGDGIDKYCDLIEEIKQTKGMDSLTIDYADESVRYQDAETVALIGAVMAAAGETTDYEQLKPVYMRAAEAERKLKEKQRNG